MSLRPVFSHGSTQSSICRRRAWEIVRAWRGQQEEQMLGRALTAEENGDARPLRDALRARHAARCWRAGIARDGSCIWMKRGTWCGWRRDEAMRAASVPAPLRGGVGGGGAFERSMFPLLLRDCRRTACVTPLTPCPLPARGRVRCAWARLSHGRLHRPLRHRSRSAAGRRTTRRAHRVRGHRRGRREHELHARPPRADASF